MQKVYKGLTQEQKDKNIIFTSTLSEYRTETLLDLTHEVKSTDTNKEVTVERLLNDSFFNSSPLWKYNIIRK
uniref:Uncharacterized protein n=1 Tax=viral metagenome TaxID=1070528 RepID=A0A6H2A6I6_9ZZZZ